MDSDQLPDISEDENQIILQRKKKNVKLSDEEVLLMLRSYQVYPCSWIKIIECVKENKHHLPEAAQTMIERCSYQQLKNRLSNKLSKLLATPEKTIKNELIKKEIQKIKENEKRLINEPKKDKREEILQTLSSDDDESNQPSTSTTSTIQEKKPTSTYSKSTSKSPEKDH